MVNDLTRRCDVTRRGTSLVTPQNTPLLVYKRRGKVLVMSVECMVATTINDIIYEFANTG